MPFLFYFFIKICIKHINSETKKLLYDSSQGIDKNMLKTSDSLQIKMLAGTAILEATLSFVLYQLRTELSNIDCLQPHREETQKVTDFMIECVAIKNLPIIYQFFWGGQCLLHCNFADLMTENQ